MKQVKEVQKIFQDLLVDSEVLYLHYAGMGEGSEYESERKYHLGREHMLKDLITRLELFPRTVRGIEEKNKFYDETNERIVTAYADYQERLKEESEYHCRHCGEVTSEEKTKCEHCWNFIRKEDEEAYFKQLDFEAAEAQRFNAATGYKEYQKPFPM